MKFGKHIQNHAISEWSAHYMNYKALKKIINGVVAAQMDNASPASPDTTASLSPVLVSFEQAKTHFFFKVERELEKVNAFYVRKENELKGRLRSLLDKKDLITSRGGRAQGNVTLFTLKDALLQFQEDLTKLQNFVEVNSTGFRKILKKWDKRSKSQTKELYISRQVEVQPCFNSDVLRELADGAIGAAAALEKLCSEVDASQLEQEDGKYTESAELIEFESWLLKSMSKTSESSRTSVRNALANRKSLPDGFLDRLLWKMCGSSGITADFVALLESFSILDFDYCDGMNDKSCLHEACISGNVALVELVLSRGANIESRDIYGRCPIHYATMNGHIGVVSLLLDKGAQIDPVDHDGYTPVLLGANYPEVVTQLIKFGCALEPLSEDSPSLISLACQFGREEIVKSLLERSVKLTSADAEGLYPIHIACRDGQASVVKLLLIHSASEVDRKDKYNGWRPLFYAASEGHVDVVKILLSFKSRVDMLDEQGRNPAAYALWHGHVDVAELLRTANFSAPSVSRPSTPVQATADDSELPALELPPPLIPLYGHTYLDEKFQLLVTLGHPSTTLAPAMRFFGSRQFSSMKLVVSLRGEGDNPLGVPYTLTLPSQEPVDHFKFQGSDNELSRISVKFSFFPTFGTKPFADVVLTGEQIQNITTSLGVQHGDLRVFGKHLVTCPIVGADMKAIGNMNLELSVILPYKKTRLDLDDIGTYWKSGQSVITATSLGAEYLEVPVHILRDGTACVSDDDFIMISDVRVPVETLSGDEYTRRECDKSMDVPRDSDLVAWNRYIRSQHLTLNEVLNKLDPSIGLCIDIKYPYVSSAPSVPSRDVNVTADLILEVVYASLLHSRRSIVISSFNPTICHAINLKQPNFPVFLRTSCGYGAVLSKKTSVVSRTPMSGSKIREFCIPSHSSINSIQQAVAFAKQFNMLGVICDARAVIQVPSLIEAVKESGLLLSTYGQLNTEPKNVHLQLENGVDGVIANGIYRVSNAAQLLG